MSGGILRDRRWRHYFTVKAETLHRWENRGSHFESDWYKRQETGMGEGGGVESFKRGVSRLKGTLKDVVESIRTLEYVHI